MVIATDGKVSLLLPVAVSVLTAGWLLLRRWYYRCVVTARQQVYNRQGDIAPGQMPKVLVGNIPDVYGARNRLAAYNAFHQKFGEVVQIFWLWRQQLSVSNYPMARQILVTNQRNYSKFRPNSLLRRLFGHSVLTSEGKTWQRQRLLMNEVFSKPRIQSFHPVFVDYSEKLSQQWTQAISESAHEIRLDIYPGLTALFLDLISKAAIGHDFAALEGESDGFLKAIKYIEYQSTQPLHQFVSWWKYVPTRSNRRLQTAFQTVDDFLYQLIYQRKNSPQQPSANANYPNILELLLKSTELVDSSLEPLTEKEIRDNLLAIVVNGYETVATTVALSLFLLAQHPEKMACAQAEIDDVMVNSQGRLSRDGVAQLSYLNAVLLEVLRYAPAVAGLQRIGAAADVLANDWSIPAQQVVGITLGPLHRDPSYFGSQPNQFRPERYLDSSADLSGQATEHSSERRCPFHKLGVSFNGKWNGQPNQNAASVRKPLTFGDGARKCLGEHFALYEMKVALATLLYRFDFQTLPNVDAELELGKFGLFLSTFPKEGVEMMIRCRTPR